LGKVIEDMDVTFILTINFTVMAADRLSAVARV
jgi:hypothetical protein